MVEEAFLSILQETIGEAQTVQYKPLIMQHARTGCRFINSLSFSPDGKTVAAGCAGGIITLSEVETGAEISHYRGALAMEMARMLRASVSAPTARPWRPAVLTGQSNSGMSRQAKTSAPSGDMRQCQ